MKTKIIDIDWNNRQEIFADVLTCPNCSFECNHFKHVTLYTGDDDFRFTDAIRVSTDVEDMGDDNRLNVLNVEHDSKFHTWSPMRIRGEICCVATFTCENCSTVWDYNLFHSKGQIYTCSLIQEKGVVNED